MTSASSSATRLASDESVTSFMSVSGVGEGGSLLQSYAGAGPLGAA